MPRIQLTPRAGVHMGSNEVHIVTLNGEQTTLPYGVPVEVTADVLGVLTGSHIGFTVLDEPATRSTDGSHDTPTERGGSERASGESRASRPAKNA